MNKNTIKSIRWHKKKLIRLLSESFNVDELDWELERVIKKANDIRLMKLEFPIIEIEEDETYDDTMYDDDVDGYED